MRVTDNMRQAQVLRHLQDNLAELVRVIEQVIQLGNTRVGSEHLFGGHQTAAPPF